MTLKVRVSPAWLAALPGTVTALRIPFDDEIHQALPQADRKEQDHDSKHDAVILSQAGDGVVEDQEQHGADHWSQECGYAAEHVDEDALARNGPIGEFRIGSGDEQRHDDPAD